MGYTLKIEGLDFRAIAAETRKKLSLVVRATAFSAEGRMKLAIQSGPKTGRVYQVVRSGSRTGKAYKQGPRRRVHQASAPGEAPATDTGHLVNSIQTQMVGDLSAVITIGAEYAEVLELGSVSGKQAARPFVETALSAVQPAFERAVEKVLEGA